MSTLYENYENSDHNISIFGVEWWSQSFIPSITHRITSISILCYKEELLPETYKIGDITAGIYLTDENGYPTGEILCSGTTDVDTLPESYQTAEWKEIIFNTPYVLSANTKYTIVIDARDGNELALLRWKVTSFGSYASGVLVKSNDSGVTWSEYANDEYDGTFREYGDPISQQMLPSIDLSLQTLWGW